MCKLWPACRLGLWLNSPAVNVRLTQGSLFGQQRQGPVAQKLASYEGAGWSSRGERREAGCRWCNTILSVKEHHNHNFQIFDPHFSPRRCVGRLMRKLRLSEMKGFFQDHTLGKPQKSAFGWGLLNPMWASSFHTPGDQG